MKIIIILLFALFPCCVFSQVIQVEGAELSSGDVLDWKVSPLLMSSVPANMIAVDSITVKSNPDLETFYSELSKILKAEGFGIEAGIDYKVSAFKAHKSSQGVELLIAAVYNSRIFRSFSLPNNARLWIFATVPPSSLSAADLKSIEKIKTEITKRIGLAPKKVQPANSPTVSADERRVMNLYSRRALPMLNMIDGERSIEKIAQLSRMENEEVARICTFLVAKGFAYIKKR